MVSLKDIKGQDNVVRFLEGSFSSGRLSSSYLFSGPRGVGRGLAAGIFIKTLICSNGGEEHNACGVCPACMRLDASDHPDLTWIKPAKNKKIKIEEIRKIKEVLSLKPYEAPVNVCVIEDAHMMTVEASNALLKVLEEPPGESILILISEKKELLLPTVVSRCTEVRFHSLSITDTAEIISENTDIDSDAAHFLACFSQGSPGRAMEMLEEGVIDRRNAISEVLEQILEEENPACMSWDNESKDDLLEDLELLLMFFRDVAIGREGLKDMVLDKEILGPGMSRFLEEYRIDAIYEIAGKLIGLKRALEGNVNPKLVAQALPGMLK